jgi:hypothetical protein
VIRLAGQRTLVDLQVVALDYNAICRQQIAYNMTLIVIDRNGLPRDGANIATFTLKRVRNVL